MGEEKEVERKCACVPIVCVLIMVPCENKVCVYMCEQGWQNACVFCEGKCG